MSAVSRGIKAFRQDTCARYQSLIMQAFRLKMEGLKTGEAPGFIDALDTRQIKVLTIMISKVMHTGRSATYKVTV